MSYLLQRQVDEIWSLHAMALKLIDEALGLRAGTADEVVSSLQLYGDDTRERDSRGGRRPKLRRFAYKDPKAAADRRRELEGREPEGAAWPAKMSG